MSTETTQPTPFVPTEALAKKILAVVDAGLSRGLGRPIPGRMCVEAAVCYAMDLPHSDRPTCVGEAVRITKITLNDSTRWSDPLDRANGLRALSIAQLGSNHISQYEFSRRMYEKSAKILLPKILRIIPRIPALEAIHGAAEETATIYEKGGLSAGKLELEKIAVYLGQKLKEVQNIDTPLATAILYLQDSLSEYVVHLNAYEKWGYREEEFLKQENGLPIVPQDEEFASSAARVAIYGGLAFLFSKVGKELGQDPSYYVKLTAGLALEVLKEMESPGCQFLYLLDQPSSQPPAAV